MEPRLKSSKKWTSLPSEYLAQINEVFQKNFQELLGEKQLFVEGRIYPKELLLRVGLGAKDRLSRANFEISIEYDKNKENVVQLVYLAIDCLASMMNDYFNDNTTEFPHRWQEFKVDKKMVHLQFSTVNPELEAQADELLGESEKPNLVQGEDEVEERTAVNKMLGLDDNDDQ